MPIRTAQRLKKTNHKDVIWQCSSEAYNANQGQKTEP